MANIWARKSTAELLNEATEGDGIDGEVRALKRTLSALNLVALGAVQLAVDGEAVDLASQMVYKGTMLSGVPNAAMAIGYTNASWTLKVDLVCEHLCRMLAHMDAEGHDTVTPILDEREIELRPLLDFQAGYVQRTVDSFPRQGSHGPWKVQMSYKADRRRLRNGPVEDPALCFQTSPSAHRPQPVAA